jgi:hypothetical protein
MSLFPSAGGGRGEGSGVMGDRVTPKANRSSSGAILFAIDNLPEASECVFINYVGRDRVTLRWSWLLGILF